ncbi:hypothetical protein U9M48_023694 [Paspalum notatum var. saurae]|uniref:Uncharacterized protein n=1 Tax=Paspalum notatum var. saurae TaxID=547442 RepID=A0AAQ3TK93_PASNO
MGQGVQRWIGLWATWRASEDCVEAKKMKSSSWLSVPDISVFNHRTSGGEKESLGNAWAHIMTLASSGPHIAIPEPMFLKHFYVGLNPKTKEFLDGASRGSFLHLMPKEGRAILENTPFKPPDEPS